MWNNIIFASVLVFLMYSGCIFARSVPTEFSYDKTTESNNLHNEDQTTAPLLNEHNPGDDVPLTNQVPSSNSSNPGFSWSWRNLLPNHFGEFFEVFVFFMELKWHYEIEESIAAVGYRISNDLTKNNMDQMEVTETDSNGSKTNEVENLFGTAKYPQYYLNAMAPLKEFIL